MAGALALVATLASPSRSDTDGSGDESIAIRSLLAEPMKLASWLRDRDPAVDSARAKIVAATEAGQQARVLPNPQLSAAVGGITIGSGTPPMQGTPAGPTGFDSTSNFTLGLGEEIELGKRGPRKRAADLRAAEARQAALGTLGGRINDATTTLGKLAYVVARHDVVAANLDASRQLQESEKTRLDKKDLSGADFARIELDTEELEIQLGRADADVAVSIAGCSATMAARCLTTGLDATALDVGAPLPDSLPATEAALTGRPTRQATKLEITALGADASLAEHRKIPDPTVGVAYTYDNYTFGGSVPQTLQFSVSFPLALFDTGKHDAAAARANAHATELQDKADLRTARGNVEALVAQLKVLRTTLDRLEKDSVPKSAMIVTQAKRAFDIGETGIAELLLAERSHRDLLLEVLDTRFDLFNLRVSLRQELGLDDDAARSAEGTK